MLERLVAGQQREVLGQHHQARAAGLGSLAQQRHTVEVPADICRRSQLRGSDDDPGIVRQRRVRGTCRARRRFHGAEVYYILSAVDEAKCHQQTGRL